MSSVCLVVNGNEEGAGIEEVNDVVFEAAKAPLQRTAILLVSQDNLICFFLSNFF